MSPDVKHLCFWNVLEKLIRTPTIIVTIFQVSIDQPEMQDSSHVQEIQEGKEISPFKTLLALSK